ncbi:MAG TPA: sulfite exporter TauE/SafE family protein [Gemmatimonadaceae bacterium]|nr:sulfite exporter TauE/SafE family protein [Gemmatimonadaceae bacterium]
MIHPTAVIVATALAAGALHAFGPDHLAAVSVFVSQRPSRRRAMALGARWGAGHSLSLLLLGGVVTLSDVHLPERFGPLAERMVGVVLIALGMVGVMRALRIHGHWHAHGDSAHWHLHSHRKRTTHEHDHHALFGIGMLHGLAGTGAVVVLVPVATLHAPATALLFLVVFGLGTIASMAVLSALAGTVVHAAAQRSPSAHRVLAMGAAVASIAVGFWWVAVGGA